MRPSEAATASDRGTSRLARSSAAIRASIARHKIPLLLFAGLSIVAAFPILLHLSRWGQSDWDQHDFYQAVPRRELLTFGQFPLWNPYHCGGTPCLANPQSTFLSPLFLLVLAFGAPLGLKLQVFVALFTGMTGMYFLSRTLGMAAISACVPAVLFWLGSWFPLRVNVGHTIFFVAGCLPWSVFFFLKSLDDWRYLFLAALGLVLLVFGGAVYSTIFLVMILGLHAALLAIQRRSARPIALALATFLGAGLLGAVKILPMLEFSSRYVDRQQDTQYQSFGLLLQSLIERDQESIRFTSTFLPKNVPFDQVVAKRLAGELPWDWHEYGSYVGVVALLLAVASLFGLRRYWPLHVGALVFGVLALGTASAVDLWSPLHALPLLSSLHGPSRFVIPLTFYLALLAGITCSRIESGRARGKSNQTLRRWAILVVAGILVVDLLLVSWPVYEDAFTMEPPVLQESAAGMTPVWSTNPFRSQFPNFVQGLATINGYERVHPPIRAAPAFADTGERNGGYHGEAYLAATGAGQRILHWSPNRVVVAVEPKQEDLLVLNQNYDPGWKATGRTVVSHEGLAAVPIRPGDSRVEFTYRPQSFLVGVVVSAVSLAGMIFAITRFRAPATTRSP